MGNFAILSQNMYDPRTSHRPVFDRFKYIESRSDQKLTVGRPGNKANLQRMSRRAFSGRRAPTIDRSLSGCVQGRELTENVLIKP